MLVLLGHSGWSIVMTASPSWPRGRPTVSTWAGPGKALSWCCGLSVGFCDCERDLCRGQMGMGALQARGRGHWEWLGQSPPTAFTGPPCSGFACPQVRFSCQQEWRTAGCPVDAAGPKAGPF